MAPPELAGDTPVTDVVQPLAVNLGKTLRNESDIAILYSISCRLCQRLHLYEPLSRNHWLNGRVAAGAMAYCMLVILNRNQYTSLLQVLQQSLAALIAVHAGIFACIICHLASIGNYFNLLQIVSEAHLVVVRVMGWSNLYGTSTKLHIYIFISKQRNFSIYYWQDQSLANQVSVALIVWMYSYTAITQHSLRTSCSHLYILVGALYLISEVPEMASLSLMLNLDVRDCSVAVCAPVGDAGALINQPLFVKTYKYLADSTGASLVHGKALAVPVAGGAKGTELAHDTAAKLFLPLPYALQKLLTAQLIAVGTLFTESTLYLSLSSDTCMVTAWHPQGVVALHTAPADEDILQGIIKGMAHMKLTCYIWWRFYNAVWLLVFLNHSTKQLILFPEAIPLLFEGLWVIHLRDIVFFHY